MKKWPLWNGERVVGRLPRRHFACVVQYPGDDVNWWVEPRKMPSRKRCLEIIDRLEAQRKLSP